MDVIEFAGKEDGVVTVDWVVLTGALVGLGVSVLATVSSGTSALSGEISQALDEIEVASPASPGVSKGGGLPYTPPGTVALPVLPPPPPSKSP